jgi:ParB family chromosome partitioning protein
MRKRQKLTVNDLDLDDDVSAVGPAPDAAATAPEATPASRPVLIPAAPPRAPAFHADVAASKANTALREMAALAEAQAREATERANEAAAENFRLREELERAKANAAAAGDKDAEFAVLDPDAIFDTMPGDRFPIAFSDATFESLLESIRSQGQIEPIVVRRPADAGRRGESYEVVTGRRRLRALRQIGRKVLARIIEADDAAALGMMYAENEERADISALERGRWFRACLDRLGTTQNDLAARFRLTKSTVSQYVSIAELPDELLQRFADPRRISYNKGTRLLKCLRDDADAYDRIIAALDQLTAKRAAGYAGAIDEIDLAISAGEGRGGEQAGTPRRAREIRHKGRKFASLSNASGIWTLRFDRSVDEGLANRLADELPKLAEQLRAAALQDGE